MYCPTQMKQVLSIHLPKTLLLKVGERCRAESKSRSAIILEALNDLYRRGDHIGGVSGGGLRRAGGGVDVSEA